MFRRVSVAATVLGVAMVLITGCGGSPEPTETTPSFSSEDEAFAAAEATYRAYVDALNEVDLADPATFEPVFALTTGEANASAREEFSQMHANSWTVGGASVLVGATAARFQLPTRMELIVCVDVSAVTLTDPTGNSMVSPERPDQQVMQVDMMSSSDRAWLIEQFSPAEDDSACEQSP